MWQVERHQRTRQLIELGNWAGLSKAGLIELTDDDCAVILGMLVEADARVRGDERDQTLMLWRRRGKRAFDADAAEQ